MAGSDVTFANAWAQWAAAIKIVNASQNFGSVNTPNLLDMEDALTTILDGEFTPGALELVRSAISSRVAAGLTRDSLRQVFRPFLLEVLRTISSQELSQNVSDERALRVIRQYMEDNTESIKTASPTFDTSATGTVTGTGAISRLTVDKDSNNLECFGVETKIFVCDLDQNNGRQKHNERFEFRFGPLDASGLQFTGTGGTLPVDSLHCKSSPILRNPSFEEGALTTNTALASTTQITGWTATTAANWKTRSTSGYYYRGYPGAPSTLWGLECTASDTLTQVVLTANPGATFPPETPFHFQIAWQRKASATGNLTIHLGSQSTTVAIGTGTNDQWNVLQLDLDSSRFYDNFKEDDLDVKIDVASLATGTVVIDDVVLAPMVNLDGTWWAVTGGATPWLKGDTRIFSGDARGATAIINYWLWRAYGDLVVPMLGWFPTSGSPSIADPS